MKDNRPSRKESKAQSNIREYLQDIAMGYTTHVKTSTVGMWRNRYKDFRKSEKQAWRDYENLFENAPVVNEVEAPKPAPAIEYIIYDEDTLEEAEVSCAAYKLLEGIKKKRDKEKKELIGDTTIEKYDRNITVPSYIANTIRYWDSIDEKIIIGMIMLGAILGRVGHCLYTAM